MKSEVVIVKRKNDETYQEAVKRALIPLKLESLLNFSQKILIDLNLLLNENYQYGNITDPRTCEGIVDYLINDLKIPAQNVWVGDGGYPYETPGAIERLKLPEMAKKYGFKVIDLNHDERIDNIKVKNPFSLKKANLSKIAYESDVIISVPSLKTHCMAVTTLSIKNLMGALQPKGQMHANLHKKLADYLSLFPQKIKIGVIDGFIGSDGMEEGGSPVEMDLVITGLDLVAVDTVGSAVIGYSVKDCQYLKYCNQKKLGECNLENIKIIGEPIKSVKKKFKR